MRKLIVVFLIGVTLMHVSTARAGFVERRLYTGISGTRMADLRGHIRDPKGIENLWPKFPDGNSVIVDRVAAIGLQSPHDDFTEGVQLTDNYATYYRGNGSEIADSTAPFLSIPAARVSDSGEYTVEVRDANGASVTGTAALTVVPDRTPPDIVAFEFSPGEPVRFTIEFSEPVDKASAENLDNYQLDRGLPGLRSAILSADGRSIELTGNWDFDARLNHTFLVKNNRDLSNAGNVISPNPEVIRFTIQPSQDFDFDFNHGLPEMVDVFGSARVVDTGGPDGSGYLSLTDQTGQQSGAVRFDYFSRIPTCAVRFGFDSRVDSGTSIPGLGFSFNIAEDLPDGVYPFPEEGYDATGDSINADGLMISFDNFNADRFDLGPGFEVKYRGESIGFAPAPVVSDGESRVENGVPSINRDGWVRTEITLKRNGTLSLIYDGFHIFDDLDVGYEFVEGWVQIGLGARTGGVTQSHHVDNLSVNHSGTSPAPVHISKQPASVDTQEQSVVSLEVVAGGGGCPDYQWFKDGTIIPGATSRVHRFTAKPSDAGRYAVRISNEFSEVFSEPATVTVDPDRRPPRVVSVDPGPDRRSVIITFDEPVTIGSGGTVLNYHISRSVRGEALGVRCATVQGALVYLDTEEQDDGIEYELSIRGVSDISENGNIIEPVQVQFQSPALPPHLVYDFNSGVPDGVSLFGTARIVRYGSHDGSGYLSLTDALAQQTGAAKFRYNVNFLPGFRAKMKVRVAEGTERPADGFSFNIGDDLPFDTYPQAEEGYAARDRVIEGQGLMVAFDNRDSGSEDNGPGYEIKYRGESKAFTPSPDVRDTAPRVENGVPSINRSGWVDLSIEVDRRGLVTVIYDGFRVFDAVPGGIEGGLGSCLGLGARTGGAWETHWVDDLEIRFDAGELFSVRILSHPCDATVIEGERVTLEVGAVGNGELSYQWFKDGDPIEGADLPVLEFVAAPSDSGSYEVRVQDPFSETFGAAEVVVGTPDMGLQVRSVSGGPDGLTVEIILDEPVRPGSAALLDHYAITESVDGSVLGVTGATVSDDGLTITLTTVPQSPATAYDVRISGLIDASERGDVMRPVIVPFETSNGDSTLPWLRVRRLGNNDLELTWGGGRLEVATHLRGPYAEVVGAQSPYLLRPDGESQFARVRKDN